MHDLVLPGMIEVGDRHWVTPFCKRVAQTNFTGDLNPITFHLLNCQVASPNFSVLDLKAHYRGCRYLLETIQMLPQKPDDNLVS